MNNNRAKFAPLKITICLPELHMLQKVMDGELVDATYIIQGYIADGLRSRGHKLNFIGSYYPDGTIYSGELNRLKPASHTWTNNLLFEVVRKAVWHFQRLIKIPYLNIFSNLRLLDACLQTLPGNDLVYERSAMYRFGVAMACKRLRIPYILYFEADDILEHDIMKKPITGLLRWQAKNTISYNLRSANRVICVSEPLKKHLVNKWKVSAHKIVVFPNVADIRRFRPNPNARKIVRESFGIVDAPLVIFVGNFYEWHDVTTLLKSFAQVLDAYPDARMMLVGDGAKRQAMAQLAIEMGLGNTVIFTGMVRHSDVPQFMAAADVAVVPYPVSDEEIWLSPLKLFEYMATGNAIIASNVGQLSGWIVDEQNGLLVPPGDVSSLATAIGRLINDSSLRLRLGERAREEAVQKHSWDGYLSNLEELYVSVTSKRK